MTGSEDRSWLSPLPVAGYEVEVILKTGHKIQMSWARISADGRMIHIGIIKEPENRGAFPTIPRTIEIVESYVLEISLREEKNRPEIRTFRRPPPCEKKSQALQNTGWLKDLPKSGDCHIFLLCDNRDRMIEIKKGWIEYDTGRIHLNEITGRRTDKKTGTVTLESVRHERQIGEVIAILISVADGPVTVFTRVIKQKPDYKH